jgi:putative FmdB family regulatory protein
MPIFDFVCSECDKEFEDLVLRPDEEVKCPVCGGGTRKRMSAFAAPGSGGHTAPAGGCGPGGG